MFLGRRRQWRTEHHYDDADRLVESITTEVDPEWDDDDRQLALDFLAEEALRCKGCGLPLDETTDPKNQGRYTVPPPTRCHACTALHGYVGAMKNPAEAPMLHFLPTLGPPIAR